MAATVEPRQAINPATIVGADVFATVIQHQVREADHVGQREHEHGDPGKRHVLRIARPAGPAGRNSCTHFDNYRAPSFSAQASIFAAGPVAFLIVA